MKNIFSAIIFLLSLTLFNHIEGLSQLRIISGPIHGPVELRDAKVWVAVSPEVKTVSLQYNKRGDSKSKTVFYKGELGNDFNSIFFTVGGPDFNTTYNYKIGINGKATLKDGELTAKDLWQRSKLTVSFLGLKGETPGEWRVDEKELKNLKLI